MGYGEQYITNPVPEGVSAMQELTHVWHIGTRGPEHARNWRVKVEREWPELHAAIQRVIGAQTGVVHDEDVVGVITHEHAYLYGMCTICGAGRHARGK